MSASSRRRHSKWDHKESEALPENFHDRAQPRKPREPLSPDRGSRRLNNRSKESMMTWDREENSSRMSPGIDEWRRLHRSRSPRNGLGRSHRISRSKSRSQSPAHNFRRDSVLDDRSRSKSGVSAQICRDFTAGRCRRGNHCQFLHQDVQPYDNRRPVECSSPDDWDSRHRRIGGSRYSPDDTKEYSIKNEKSMRLCNDFLKGRCRSGSSCRYLHDSTVDDAFEKGPPHDVYRDRDHDRRSRDTHPDNDQKSRDSYPDHEQRSRDTYSDRNHEREPLKKGENLCKFFAAGNCRFGTRCRYSHQLPEVLSPERSQDDKRGLDDKFEGGQIWKGPKWSDITVAPNVPVVHGWGEEENVTNEVAKEVTAVRFQNDWKGPDHEYKGHQVLDGPRWSDVTAASNITIVDGWGKDRNEITEVAKEVTTAKTPDDLWSYGILNVEQTLDAPATTDELREKQPLQWKMENNVPGMGLSASTGTENFSGDMEISPRDIKQQGFNFSNSQTPPLSNISFPAVQQHKAGEASYEKHYPAGFQKQKVLNDPFSEPNPSYKEDKPTLYPVDLRNVIGNNDGSYISDQPVNAPHGQGNFQTEQSVNVQPITSIGPPAVQGEPLFPSHPSGGERMQIAHNPSSFLDSKVADGPHMVNSTSALAPGPTSAHNTVSSEQLVQLSNLSASLAQLFESRQQLPHLSSAVTSHGMINFPDSAASVPPISGAMIQPNQAPETVKQYDPIFDSIETKRPNLGNHMLPSAEQKPSDNDMRHEGGNVNQQEPLAVSKDDENGRKTAEERSKAPENEPYEDVAVEGADDGKKPKDTKGIRPFKFALAEFVKELLKPTWKDGQVSKEVYKTIVKKVVDKVIETQGPQIPQTKEKIDQYLSCSKQKIDKLVQAYVGKYQKS